MPSSVIRSYRYDSDRRALAIVFQSGRRYVYEDVPAETYASMQAAISKGAYFNRNIRDSFTFRRDDDAEPLMPRGPAGTLPPPHDRMPRRRSRHNHRDGPD